MAGYLARGFDLPVTIPPATARTVTYAYNQGLLSQVSSGAVTYGSLSYHPNLLISQVSHGNGISETQTNDPNSMRRPSALAASGPYASWSSGTYSYDGAGNIKAIGTASYRYDKVNRLVASSLFDGPTGGGNFKQQSYTFDPYGNLTSITTNGMVINTPTSPSTNRLTGMVTYDAAGNLTKWNETFYQYDLFNQMTRMTGPEDWYYIYTADDERIWSYSTNLSRWTLRDLGGKVLREYTSDIRGWTVGTDYIYRDGLLLAGETQLGRRHYHLDHLGTPRLITTASGDAAAYHAYYPFGEEATAISQDKERMKFTGHERDLGSPATSGDDLDYMHARHCSPVTGRFLSFDLGQTQPRIPQVWNRYSYTINNPIRYIDPNGAASEEPGLFQELYQFFSEAFSKGAPPQQAQIDPSAQALVDEGEISQSQALRMTPSSHISTVQQGLNEGGAALAAGAGVVVIAYGEGKALEFAAGAVAKLESVAGKFGTSGDSLIERSLVSGRAVVDQKPANFGNVNIFLPRPDGGKGFVRITFNPERTRVISVGINKLKDLTNGLRSGRFKPI